MNKEGSDHLRNLREADKVLKFLERLKRNLSDTDKLKVSEVIDIIVKHYTKKFDNES